MTVSRRSIVLTGFMGTGKSAVASGVAKALDRPCVDMDEAIVQRAGMSIPEVFRRHGEDAFRAHERTVCEELSAQEGLVIATGGGALVDARNREILARNGCLICLDCEPEEILARLQGDTGRPMLWGDNPTQRLRELLDKRRDAYAEIPHHIDTTYRALDDVIEQVIELSEAAPTTWTVSTPTGDYQVHLHQGGLSSVGALMRARAIGPRVVVVSDENVWPLHGERILNGLRSSRYSAASVVVPAGEEQKNLDTVRTLYDAFVEAGLDRSGAVIAVGGGVVTDMAGFAAASFMRGVSLVQVPTTLLGMVDASVGGKVAVDHPQGKNLIGAFVKPLLVMLDPNALETLPEEEYRSGMAEVIKAGIIGDPELFAALESGAESDDMVGAYGNRWRVERALAVKIAIVEEDPYERGRRAVLNLGHTYAHAFEVLGNYQLHHGMAVGIGMAAAANLAEIRGLCTARSRERIIATLRRHRLPTRYDAHPPEAVYQAMRTDKKRRGTTLRFILHRDIGDVVIDEAVSREQVIASLERIRQ